MNKFIVRQFFYLVIVFCLASCHSQIMRSWRPHTPLSAEQYQRRASQASDANERTHNLAWATEQLIWQHRFKEAQKLLNQLPKQAAFLNHILYAQWALLNKHPRLASYHLSLSDLPPTTNVLMSNYWQARNYHWRICTASQMQDQSDELIQRSKLINWMAKRGFELEEPLLAMWHALPTQPPTLTTTHLNADTDAWLTLKQLVHTWSANNQQWLPTLIHWRETHPNHLANRLFSTTVTQMHSQLPMYARRIALLLPLHGHYAEIAKAIHNGFLAAYYQLNRSSKVQIDIRVFDTTTEDVQKAYQMATNWNADFVVGPLQPKHVQEIANLEKRPVPVLALNWPRSSGYYPGLYCFGLFPEDEVNQLADRMIKQHKRFVLAIAPKGDWGKRVIHTFQTRLQNKGGTVIDTLYFDNDPNQLTAQLKQLLHIDRSEERLQQLQALSDEDINFIARRRHDITAIFLAASIAQQERIIPLLRFFYVMHVPIYLVPQTGSLAAYHSHDLNQILLGSMPWFVEGASEVDMPLTMIHKQVKHTWKRSNVYQASFYAMGVDAYYLIWYWPRLLLLPHLGIDGATGQLYLDNQHIHRRLLWSKISKEHPIIVEPSCLESFF